MSGPPGAAVAILLGYLLGAVPFGIIVGRLAGGIDPRTAGSGRTGATNVLRTVGRGGAVAVFVLDVAKGAVVVLAARWLFTGQERELVAAAAGIAAIVGHIRSVFIGFTGGRGVATAAGGLLALSPICVAILAPITVAVIWRWRFVSLGSLSAAAAAPVVTGLLALVGAGTIEAFAYAVGAALLVVVGHADNIGRLRAGTERRLGEKEAIARDG